MKILGFGCPVNVYLSSKHEDQVLYLGKHERSDSSKFKEPFFVKKTFFLKVISLFFSVHLPFHRFQCSLVLTTGGCNLQSTYELG